MTGRASVQSVLTDGRREAARPVSQQVRPKRIQLPAPALPAGSGQSPDLREIISCDLNPKSACIGAFRNQADGTFCDGFCDGFSCEECDGMCG